MLTKTSVLCFKPDGKPAFKNPRPIRFRTTDKALCVKRHKKAVLVTKVLNSEAVEVDLAAPRIGLGGTKAATEAELPGLFGVAV